MKTMGLEELKSEYEKMLRDLPDTTPEFRAKRTAFKIGYDMVSAILEEREAPLFRAGRKSHGGLRSNGEP